MSRLGRCGGTLRLLGGLVCLAAGCTSYGEIDAWPFYTYEPETQRFPARMTLLGPLVDIQWKKSVTQYSVRPFFSVRKYRDVPYDRRIQWDVPYFAPPAILTTMSRREPPRTEPGKGRTGKQVLSLFRIYKHESCPPDRRSSLLLWFDWEGRDEDGGKWHHWGFLPFYLAGETDRHGSYSAVFPFGGTLKNLFGRDEISFILWPVYSRTKTGDRRSTSILLAYNTAEGGKRDVWHLLPFYARIQRHDRPTQYWVLWPIISWTAEPKKGERDEDVSIVFPFWGRIRMGHFLTKFILWPFYMRGENQRTGRVDIVSWPFYRRGWGPKYERFALWPFYGYLRDRHVTRRYILWPFWRREWRETPRYRMSGTSVLLYRESSEEWEAPDGTLSTGYEEAFWPLWYYKRDRYGNTYFASLNLRGAPDAHGWDRILAPLWRLWETQTRVYQDGPVRKTWHSTRVLFEAFRYDHDEDTSFLRVFPLFSRRTDRGRTRSLQLLMGLLGYADRPGGKRTYRFLFIPWTVNREENE